MSIRYTYANRNHHHRNEARFDDHSSATEKIDPQDAAQTLQPFNRPFATPEPSHQITTSSTHDQTTSQKMPPPQAPWKSVQTLHRSRFIQAFFGIAQFNTLSTLAAFFPLFFLGLNKSVIGLWMVIGFIVIGWMGWILVWFAAGVSFSRLFEEVQVDAVAEGDLEDGST